MSLRLFGCGVALGGAAVLVASPARAQNFRFELRAEPDVIPANGLSTTSIFVQVPQSSSSIVPVSSVRFATTAGSIESQAMLSGGVARVLLRSANTPGTATITAFIGNARETTTVEFAEETGLRERYLEVAAPYVAYGNGTNIITSSGAGTLDFGDLHVESDVRLDVDLANERLWAQGNAGGVRIRNGRGSKAVELRGDRLFYDLRRRQGVMRRGEGDASSGSRAARQEFAGANFGPLPPPAPGEETGAHTPASASPPSAPSLVAPPQAPTSIAQGRDNLTQPTVQGLPGTTAPAPNENSGAPDKQAPLNPSTPLAPDEPTAPGDQASQQPNVPTSNEPNASTSSEPNASTSSEPNASTSSEPNASTSSEPTTPAPEQTMSPTSNGPTTSAPDDKAASTLGEQPVPLAQTPSSPDGAPAKSDASSETQTPSSPDGTTSTEGTTAVQNAPVRQSGSAVVPGSLADTPAPLVAQDGDGNRSNPLVAQPKPVPEGEPTLQTHAPAYQPLPESRGPAPRIVELPPPGFDATDGYWVTARRLRVFPRDKVQFERAKIYFNGQKAFALPIYVLPLDGSFNPQTDILAFNSRGGIGVNFPLYYQANGRGTGTVFLRNVMGGGFGTQRSGPSLAVQQQYWLNPRSHGNFSVDQIGHGDFNVNFTHQQQLDERTVADMWVSAPRHRDLFARASVQRELSQMQIGFEGFFDRPQGETGSARGQFFARMQPKNLGHTGWRYALSANALAVGRVPYALQDATSIDPGAGIGLPGRGGGIGLPGGGTNSGTRYRSLFGQTLNASFSSPNYSPWRGSSFSANLLATAYNYSDGRRGLAPGANFAFNQAIGQVANLSLSYTYDRSSIGLYGATGTSFTHYFTASASANLSPKIALSAFASRSLSDRSLYGSAGADYYFAPKWRLGAFLDYANFSGGLASNLNTGWSLGRTVGNRELSLNFDSTRRKLYFQYGGLGGLF